MGKKEDYDWIRDLDNETYEIISVGNAESIILVDGINSLLNKQAEKIFNKFDEYSAIKDDEWYKELKKSFLD